MAVIIFKATEKCNGHCAYCDVVRRKKGCASLSLDLLELVFIRINEFLSAHEDEKIQLVWHGGEPLLLGAQYFEEAARFQEKHCRSTFSRIEHALQTNLTALTPDFLPVFEKLRIMSVGTSYDPEPGIRGLGPATDTALYNSRFLRSTALLEEHGLGFGFIYVVTRKSLSKPHDIFYFLTNLKLSGGININPVLIYDSERRDLAITPREFGDFLGAIFPLWWEHRERYPDLEPFRSLVKNVTKDERSLACSDSGHCAYSHVNIDPRGGTSQCGRASDWNILSFGSIIDRTLEEILYDVKRTILADRNSILREGECKGCRFWFLCHGGCPLDSFSSHGDFVHKSEWCEAKRHFLEHHFEPLTGIAISCRNKGEE
jgi:uncharacterized protein